MGRLRARLIVVGTCFAAACGSSEPSEGLLDRLERAEREKYEARLQRELAKQKDELRREMETAERKSGLVVNLPKGASTEIDVTRVSLVIDVPVTGDVVVAGKAMPDDQLDNLFAAAFARDKATQVVIRADEGVAHGRVVAIMERAKAAGLTRLAIGTRPSGGSLGAP